VVARPHLHALVDLLDRGMREPLPLYCTTSAAYATALANDKNADRAAGQQWVSSYQRDREDRQPEHILVFGGERPLDELLADPRFAVEAEALWSGPLAFEELDDR
jgi:exodeoxyribonuclease V gamma subunit